MLNNYPLKSLINFVFLFFLIGTGQIIAQPLRYKDKIFNEINAINSVEYAMAPWLNNRIVLLSEYNIHEGENTTEERPLLMDIYLPQNDELI